MIEDGLPAGCLSVASVTGDRQVAVNMVQMDTYPHTMLSVTDLKGGACLCCELDPREAIFLSRALAAGAMRALERQGELEELER